jgi:hypothetical protein
LKLHIVSDQGCQMVNFNTKSTNFGVCIWEGTGMKNVAIHIYYLLVYILCGHLL